MEWDTIRSMCITGCLCDLDTNSHVLPDLRLCDVDINGGYGLRDNIAF